jgi:hypothetical protein
MNCTSIVCGYLFLRERNAGVLVSRTETLDVINPASQATLVARAKNAAVKQRGNRVLVVLIGVTLFN